MIWPELHDVLIGALWMAAKVILFLAVLLYSWPRGSHSWMLRTGLGVIAVDAVWSFAVFSGVFGPPATFDSLTSRESAYWEHIVSFGSQLGSLLLAVLGAWLICRQLVAEAKRKAAP